MLISEAYTLINTRIFTNDLTAKSVKIQIADSVNKGHVGLLIEEIIGLPHSSNHLDFNDGELKVFPVYKIKPTRARSPAIFKDPALESYRAKETIAITMFSRDERVLQKLKRVIFLPYYRDTDREIEIFRPWVFNLDTAGSDIRKQIEIDYQTIKNIDKLHTTNGKYIQIRTKGGKGSKSYAWYMMKSFINENILNCYQL